MKTIDKITRTIYRNSTDTSEGVLIKFENIEKLLSELEAINHLHSSLQLPKKMELDSEVVDRLGMYKLMCKPDVNFEVYFEKGFRESYYWLKKKLTGTVIV